MKVGFTGTQKGMTPEQKARVRSFLKAAHLGHAEFHHGDCVGADAEAHDIAREEGYRIVIHPPSDDKKRAFKEGDYSFPLEPYLDRNEAIVRSTDIMLATPSTNREVQRSGTWSTIRRARTLRRAAIIVYPSGEVVTIIVYPPSGEVVKEIPK